MTSVGRGGDDDDDDDDLDQRPHLAPSERTMYNAFTESGQVIKHLEDLFLPEEATSLSLDDFLEAFNFLFAIKKITGKPLFYIPKKP
jgi:hypothetical protein